MPTQLNRRHLLRAAGVAMSLPWLDAMQTPAARAGFESPSDVPQRMVCINSNMGFMPQFFWPNKDGHSDYLSLLERYRNHYTLFSGVSHPDVDGGHHAEISFLTAAPHPASSGFKNSISLDQYAAERIGFKTRFPYLSINVGAENASLSFTASGVRIPAATQPSELFKRMFVQGSKTEVEDQVRRLQDGQSVLDAVADRAKTLQRGVGQSDKVKLQQYFDSVREMEQRLLSSEQWQHRPKPEVTAPVPVDIDDRAELIARTDLMQEVIRLALETDSTRIVAMTIDQNANPKVNLEGVNEGHHSLTHHGQRKESVSQLKVIESEQLKSLARFLGGLQSSPEAGTNLLEQTMVLYGSNLGNANSHDNKNMPIILAGGGFRHGTTIEFDKQDNGPLPNLFVSMLQRIGIETDQFASSTGSMRGLELA